jgi:hypothetical protein
LTVGAVNTVGFVLAAEFFGFVFDGGVDCLAGGSVAFTVEQAAAAAAFPNSELALVDLVFWFFAVGVVEDQPGFAGLLEPGERAVDGGVNKTCWSLTRLMWVSKSLSSLRR